MAESKLSQLIDAIYTTLNNHTFSEAVTVARKYPPPFDVWKMQTIHLYVTGRDDPIDIDSREDDKLDYEIDISVWHAKDSQEDVDLSPISKIVEELRPLFRKVQLVDGIDWKDSQVSPYQEDEGIRFRLMGKLLTLTYEMYG